MSDKQTGVAVAPAKEKITLKGTIKVVAAKGKALPLVVDGKYMVIKDEPVSIDTVKMTIPAKNVLKNALADKDVKEAK